MDFLKDIKIGKRVKYRRIVKEPSGKSHEIRVTKFKIIGIYPNGILCERIVNDKPIREFFSYAFFIIGELSLL